LADYRLIKKVTKTSTFLPFQIEKLLTVVPALRITVKPALGDHLLVKLKVGTQNSWLLNEASLTGTGIVTIEFVTIVNDNWLMPS